MRKDIIDPGSGEGFKNEKFFSIAILILIIIAIGGFAIVRSDADFDLPALGGEEPAEEEMIEESAEEDPEGEQVPVGAGEDEEDTEEDPEGEQVPDGAGEDEEDMEEDVDEGETGIAHIEEDEREEAVLGEEAAEGPSYGVTAQQGDGLTHVARRALEGHLQTRGGGENLTAEHKVFIEDYIQKNLDHSTGWLQFGETVEVPVELVEEAVEEAEQLNEEQLQNLSQYTF